ncbi:MAG: hypothetical protein PHI31_06475 [Desulfuromonadaceae bacterium]|nr:hypothetical protein [Desulfuromonadaceae bacterium]
MFNIHDTCPLCLSAEFGNSRWSETIQEHICFVCRIELSVDFYVFSGSEGNYLLKAAGYLGVDELEARRRYLEEIMYRNPPVPGTNIELCRKQLRVIRQHQLNRRRSSHWFDPMILGDELTERAFGYDFEGITIEVD